jgi:dihydrofolate synthase / folylpolyglutamate synthase
MSHREYLFSLETLGIKLGLDQIRALVEHLGRPDSAFRSIVIAGTNGKGSVTAMVERGLRAAGYRTGRYTSPHLVDLEERFVIDGVPIERDMVEALAGRVRDAAQHLPAPPSFFEATTALALEAFRDARVDVAVLEVGLGGRLDATNVVHPVAVAITSVDFDHEQYLGNTIQQIAREKAGVIKPGCVVVLSENPLAVREVVHDACVAAGAEFVPAADDVKTVWTMVDGRARLAMETRRGTHLAATLALRGRHQVDNAVTAVRVLEELAARGQFAVDREAMTVALAAVEWPARLELIAWGDRAVLIDGAHNPAGAHALASYLRETYGRPLPFVFGAMRDKKIDAILEALAPVASHFVFTASDSPRAAPPDYLAEIARASVPMVAVRTAARPMDALAMAIALGDPAVVAGSLFLAGEIRAEIS